MHLASDRARAGTVSACALAVALVPPVGIVAGAPMGIDRRVRRKQKLASLVAVAFPVAASRNKTT